MNPTRAEHNKVLARRLLLDVWRDGKYELLPELITENFERINSRHTTKGMTEYRRLVELYRTAFSSLTYELHAMVADDCYVAVTYTVSGRHTGEFAGIPATGRTGTFQCLDFFEVSNGKLARVWTLTDDLGLLGRIGLHVVPGPLMLLRMGTTKIKRLLRTE